MSATPRLTFSHLSLQAVRVPLRRPIVAKVGTFETWPLLLIDLHTEQGVIGRGYLQPYQERAIRYLTPILHDLAEAQKGLPVAPSRDFDRLGKSLHLVGRSGLALIAVSGLDMAMWDALAQAAGKPLAEYLGATAGSVRAYNTNGLWLATPPDALAEEAGELVDEGGFRALKLRLGRDTLAEDLTAIEAVREGAGDETAIMVDFNQGLTLGEARHRLNALDGEGLYWFEEPLPYDDIDGCAKLAGELITPIQIGENFYGPRDALNAIQAEACTYIMPDPMRIGGVTGWLRTAALADAAGIEMGSHLYPEICAHLLRVTPTAHWLEWCDWTGPILQEPYSVSDGDVTVPDRPGSGLAWDEAAVARYRIDA